MIGAFIVILVVLICLAAASLPLILRLRAYIKIAREDAKKGLKAIIDLLQALTDQNVTARSAFQAVGSLDFANRPIVKEKLKQLSLADGPPPTTDCVSLAFIAHTIILEYRHVDQSSSLTLCSLALGDDYYESVRPCIESHEAYARRHGFNYVVLKHTPSLNFRPPAWMKVALIARLLIDGAKYISYVDADALITNPEVEILPFIDRLEKERASILLTGDEEGPNTGVMFIRNAEATQSILDLMWLYDVDIRNGTWEQFALRRLMGAYPELRRFVLIERDPRKFNSFPLERNIFHDTDSRSTWSEGDFICHFSGVRPPYLGSFINRYARALHSERAEEGRNTNGFVRMEGDGAACVLASPSETRGRTVTFSKLGDAGQFGNQLFQISAAIGYAVEHKSRAALPKWYCRLADRSYDALFPEITKYYGKPFRSIAYDEPNFSFSPIPDVKNIDLRGNFQCEKYFLQAVPIIRRLFAEPAVIKERLNEYCKRHSLTEFSALHLRAYSHSKRDGRPMGRLPDSYFLAALHKIKNNKPIVISTDDKEYLSEFLSRYSINSSYHVLTFDDPLCDFFMLSRARKIAISNSSFSWWAAYLGESEKEIYAPHRYYWFCESDRKDLFWDPRDLYPDSFREIII